MRATVVTIRTTVEPQKKTYTHTIAIAGDLARSTGERDTWRLFDTKTKTVIFVDDVERTFRKRELSTIAQERNTANATALEPHIPHAKLAHSSDRRDLLGVRAVKTTITSGGYTRELWLAEHPSIPRGLFSMMHASETPSSPLAPMMRDVDRELASVRGFPLLDRTVVPLRTGDLVIERTVVAIAQRDVPESLFVIPEGYKDLAPNGSATRPTQAGRK